MIKKEFLVVFADEEVKKAFEALENQNPELHKSISWVIEKLKENPLFGTQIAKRLIPKIYVKRYDVDNLRKCNLPGAWRLLYSLIGNEITIVSIILEWLPHKKYERRFGY